MGLKWFVLLNWVGMWFSKDQRANIIKIHVQKILDYISNVSDFSTFKSEHNWEELCI